MGDKNTKFFHDMVKRNAMRNSISVITKPNGSAITTAYDIAHEFVAFYISLLGTDVQTSPVDDEVFDWGPKGLVTSKAYEYFRPKLTRQPWKATIWKAFIPPKYSFILWLGLRGRLATRDRLAFLQEDLTCSLCINTNETAKHLFFECPFSTCVWSDIRQWLGINRRMSTILSVVKRLKKEKTGSSVQNKARLLALACTVYSLWRHRNEVIFEGKAPCPEGLVISIRITVYMLLLTLFPYRMFAL
ncbi:hypothetical protein Salat_2145500 [Sesamum alatum]|uniref:Reverse transcriptase zinc-binding domain-containing protein n=1 Tax=Sesamum alatum TaxID=300844 RepID=A0AAE1Y2M4_9LAMI|nr:hypothetical protein Salat_2145500 [Sesamum alatum]